MARLPDRFDLWVRKSRECGDPARQVDYVLGALAGLREWHFLNLGSREMPRAAEAEIEGSRYLLVFSDAERIEFLVGEGGSFPPGDPLPIMTMPAAAAMVWCLERRSMGCVGLLVNVGEDAVVFSMEQLASFEAEWSQRGGRLAAGFWIPGLTTEEQDFWQEHGL